jgi:hypothetical protein
MANRSKKAQAAKKAQAVVETVNPVAEIAPEGWTAVDTSVAEYRSNRSAQACLDKLNAVDTGYIEWARTTLGNDGARTLFFRKIAKWERAVRDIRLGRLSFEGTTFGGKSWNDVVVAAALKKIKYLKVVVNASELRF